MRVVRIPNAGGLYPSGASAEGALDMVGNVAEWTSSAREQGGGWCVVAGRLLLRRPRKCAPVVPRQLPRDQKDQVSRVPRGRGNHLTFRGPPTSARQIFWHRKPSSHKGSKEKPGSVTTGALSPSIIMASLLTFATLSSVEKWTMCRDGSPVTDRKFESCWTEKPSKLNR